MKSRFPKIYFFRDLPLAWKFSCIVIGIVLMMGVVSTFLIQTRLASALHAEHQERGMTIARDLAANSINSLLTHNRFKLHQMLSNIQSNELDVEYIFVLDSKKNIFVHTFGEEGFPAVLLDNNLLQPGADIANSLLMLEEDGRIINDFAIPVMNGMAGEIHLGLNELVILQKIKKIIQELVGIIIFVSLLGIVAAFFFVRIISAPLKSLTSASEKVGRGELIHNLQITGHDEIGQLTVTFNQMVKSIEIYRVEQNAAELQLVESYSLLTSLIDSIPDLIFYKDTKGIYLGCNKAFALFAGRDKEEIRGSFDVDLFGRDVAEFFREKDCHMLASGKYPGNEAWVNHPDGRRILLDTLNTPYYGPDDSVIGVIGVSRDITERKKNEMKLLLSKEEWEKTFNAISDIITLQDKNHCIVRANKAAYDFFEADEETLEGMKCYEVFRGSSESCLGCPSLSTFQDRKNHSEIIEHKKLGKTFHVEIAPIFDQNNDVQYLVHTAKDISDIKRLEEELFQAQKMEAVGTLAGGIAHDFNNILSSVIGFSELAKLRIQNGLFPEKEIDQILIAGNRAAELVKQILVFSHKRQSSPILQPLDPYLIIKETLKMLRSSLPTTIDIQADIDNECGAVMVEPTKLHQIVLNLCTNAFHAIENEKGILRIQLHQEKLDKEHINENEGTAGLYVVLSVTDTGCGMDKSTMDHIFDPYFTTKEVGKGTGLGLSLIHGIVYNYKGFVRVESEPGKGSTFKIYLPALPTDAVTDEKIDTKPLPSGNEHIFLVDDEKDIVAVNKVLLELSGYTVTTATDSQEALAKIRANPDQFDLIITDQTMPNLSGSELAQKILEIKPSMPIILSTGYSSVISESEVCSLGIKKYIGKPVDRKTLVIAVRDVLDGVI
jgi:PAS domain S-box-containing protein